VGMSTKRGAATAAAAKIGAQLSGETSKVSHDKRCGPRKKVDPLIFKDEKEQTRRFENARSGSSILERSDVKTLLRRIEESDPNFTVILKIKESLVSDINSLVIDEIIRALYKNKVCQALYIQNLDPAIGDNQIKSLMELLKHRTNIWCVNIGESYKVTRAGWKHFLKELPKTFVTHMYASEHVIDLEMKNAMRDAIRSNRKKHTKHCSVRNIRVIERCTNCWWNPINHIKHAVQARLDRKEAAKNAKLLAKLAEQEERENAKKRKRNEPIEITPSFTAYWKDGWSDEKPWKFKCKCGEVSSSYEFHQYMPIGRQYQCTQCEIWAHVHCVLGEQYTDDVLEELDTVLCNACLSKTKRETFMKFRSEGVRIKVDGRGDMTYEIDDSIVAPVTEADQTIKNLLDDSSNEKESGESQGETDNGASSSSSMSPTSL
jgi:hypothetical protein